METHQKDIEEKDPFGQNRRADEAEADEKSFLKALLAERALKKNLLQSELLNTTNSVKIASTVVEKSITYVSS